MAEAPDPYDYDDHNIDPPDDDDDDDQEVNRTQPFQPGAASTPYHSGEQHEMQTMSHEQEGLPDTSYEETPLLGAQDQIQRSWDSLTRLFPRASATNLETSYSKTGRLQVKMAGIGKKAYPLFTRDNNTGQDWLNPALPKEIKKSLGNSAKSLKKTKLPLKLNVNVWQKLKTKKEWHKRSLLKGNNKQKRFKIWANKLKELKRVLMPFKKNKAAILKVKQN